MLHLLESFWSWDTNPRALDTAEELAQRAVLSEDSNASGYALLGRIAGARNRPDQAIADGKREIALDPNNSFAYIMLADSLLVDTRASASNLKEALAYAEKAIRLDPRHPELYLADVRFAYNQLGEYRPALDALRAAEANSPWVHANLVFAYTELGHKQNARDEAEEVLRVAPKFSLEVLTKQNPRYWKLPFPRHFLDDLHGAGLK